MAMRSIEGDRRDPGLDRVPPRAAPLTPSTLPETTPPGTAAAIDPEVVGYLDALIDIAGPHTATPTPPHRCVAEFAEPHIVDPTIFQGNHPLSILERLASDIIPALDEHEQLRSLAGSIIAEEIERHRLLAARIHGSIMP